MLYGLWVSNFNAGAIAAALEHATNFLSSAQSQPSSGPLLVGHRTLAQSLIFSGDYRAALAHLETAASLYRPDEHRDSAFHYGQDIGVSAFVHLSWALWHRGYPDQSARAADRALALSRQLGHAHTLAHALALAGMAAVFARDVATACAYGNDCVALASEHGFAQWAAVAGFSRAGPTPKEVKRRRELPISATVWPHTRRPAPAYSHRYSSPCWPRRWRLPET